MPAKNERAFPVSARTRLSASIIAAGDGSTGSCVRKTACVTAMTSPAAIPCPEASPKRTARRPSGSGSKAYRSPPTVFAMRLNALSSNAPISGTTRGTSCAWRSRAMTSSSLKCSLSTSSIARRKASARTDTRSAAKGQPSVPFPNMKARIVRTSATANTRRREPLREAEDDRVRPAKSPLPTAGLRGDLVLVVGKKDAGRPPEVHVPHAAHVGGVEGVDRFLRQALPIRRHVFLGPLSRLLYEISARRVLRVSEARVYPHRQSRNDRRTQC